MPKLLYPNGVATAAGAYVVAQVMSDAGDPLAGNLMIDYRYDADAQVFGIDWTAIGICYDERENIVYAAGENGEIVGAADATTFEEAIAVENGGPPVHGPIRDLRLIAGSLYAVGMGRQVYRRVGSASWHRADADVLAVDGKLTAGFTSIAGAAEGLLVAVGYDGEIWEYHDGWIQVDSPTNLLLTRVRTHGEKYYASGLAGTVLCREREGWRALDTADLEHDVWDIESFAGSLYLGTRNGLFRMAADERIRALDAATFTRQVLCTKLSAGGGRLWCFGADVVSSTDDGSHWREEVIA